MAVKVHVQGAVALVAMAFMALFILIVGIVAYQRKRSMVLSRLRDYSDFRAGVSGCINSDVHLVHCVRRSFLHPWCRQDCELHWRPHWLSHSLPCLLLAVRSFFFPPPRRQNC